MTAAESVVRGRPPQSGAGAVGRVDADHHRSRARQHEVAAHCDHRGPGVVQAGRHHRAEEQPGEPALTPGAEHQGAGPDGGLDQLVGRLTLQRDQVELGTVGAQFVTERGGRLLQDLLRRGAELPGVAVGRSPGDRPLHHRHRPGVGQVQGDAPGTGFRRGPPGRPQRGRGAVDAHDDRSGRGAVVHVPYPDGPLPARPGAKVTSLTTGRHPGRQLGTISGTAREQLGQACPVGSTTSTAAPSTRSAARSARARSASSKG